MTDINAERERFLWMHKNVTGADGATTTQSQANAEKRKTKKWRGKNPTQKRVMKSISFSTAAKLPARFRKHWETED